MNESHKRISDFKVEPGEAVFLPPTDREVYGGSHIAPECITRKEDGTFVMLEWPSGLPRHETGRTVRFPHGLMIFGENMEEVAKRLVRNQLGMQTERISVSQIDSYVDDGNHWHIEPILHLTVSGEPKPHKAAGEVFMFKNITELPEGALWSRKELQEEMENWRK